MSIPNVILVVSLLSTGLFAGVMLALTAILQKQWLRMSRDEYKHAFREFLLVAKGNPVMSVLSFAGFLGPSGLAILNLEAGDLAKGLLGLGAGLVFMAGCFGVTLVFNFPIYKRVMAWNENSPAGDWESIRSRFYRLNLARLAAALLCFGLLCGFYG